MGTRIICGDKQHHKSPPGVQLRAPTQRGHTLLACTSDCTIWIRSLSHPELQDLAFGFDANGRLGHEIRTCVHPGNHLGALTPNVWEGDSWV